MSYEQRQHQQYQHHHQQQQQQPLTQKLYQSTPTSRQTVKFLTASTIGTVLLILSGLTLTGTVLALVLATPVLVLFSPILVPATMVVFVIASGFVFSGGCGVAAVSALSWIYQYTTGKHPMGADQLDRARMRITNVAREIKEKAKDNLDYVQHKGQESYDQHAHTGYQTHHQLQSS
ncbi:oleosin L [Beta vulgaris subsp. vulgaris]|uniref:oleosin L n=1 Tax=Beta vulgaris subsp. vulgaris TaxID=3555 RepID=UPI002548FA14|nr:oleosin L [Beta vulgaris subsp. vulgaris]